jgi:hypothetical protein
MTSNYHTPIATNAPVNAATFESVASDLDSAITAARSGGTLTGLNLGAAGALTISGGLVTRTLPRHTIDTEAAAATDDLTTINGGATGDILIISGANASRVVTVKHGTGNIFLASKIDKVLDDTDKQIMLVYNSSRWEETNGLHTTAMAHPTADPYRVPTNMALMAHPMARNGWGFRAAAATIQTFGVAAPTTTATLTSSNQADSTYINLQCAAVANTSFSYVTASYNLVRRAHNPRLTVVLQMVDITALRMWIGFTSAAVTNADTVAGATEFAGFRFSTVAGDTGFVPVTKDATTQTTGSAMNAIAASTRYVLNVELTSSSAIFTINNGTPTVVLSTLPATATDLGVNLTFITQAATAKNWLFSRCWVDFD